MAEKNKGMSKERLNRIRALFDQLRGSAEKKRKEEESYQKEVIEFEYEQPDETPIVDFDLLEDVSVEDAKAHIAKNVPIKAVKTSYEVKNGEVLYIVKPGESLLLIARKIYREPAKYKEIMKWNNLEKPMIHPNQKLVLKNVKSNVLNQMKQIEIEEETSLFPIEKYSYKIYKVRSGDSLSSIAKSLLGRSSYYYRLAKFNRIDARKYVVVGQKLIIPVKK